MSAFTALNGGSPSKADTPTIKVDSSVADEQLKATASPPHLPPQGTEGSRASLERPTIQTGGHPEGSLKRKRSASADLRDKQLIQERTPDTATVPPHGAGQDPFGTPKQEQRHYSPKSRERETWTAQREHEERSPYESRQGSATSPPQHTDEQVGDTLRKATEQQDQGEYPNTSPEADDRSVSYYEGQYSSSQNPDPMLQHDPKKRKRNFSNRTKTGCMTCRKRKKKCDETKPECQNCVKGGFVCAGYPQNNRGANWQKQDNKSPTVPLESKDPSYIPPGAYGMPQQGTFVHPPVKREPLPGHRGQPLRIDPPQGRPVVTDDDRPTASTLPSASVTSPDNKLSALYTPANAFPTPISANTQPPSFNDRMAKDYQRVPPLHDLSRTAEPDTPHPGTPHPTQLPQINILHATGRTSPSPSNQAQGNNPQMAAQLALTHSGYPQKRTQKEEMLSGRLFYPFDKELCLERERCAAACWRFNNLSTPPYGVSAEERSRLFLEILQPRDPIRLSPAEASPVTNRGRVGRSVTVETTFQCDYGYNISIGNNVSIGRNCTINDVCEVSIGDNTVLGPNVSIYTATLPIDPKRRQGGQGPQSGQSVTIAEDVWIGGNATLLPNIKIGKGSTIGAGSVVTKDVPPFTVFAGNPAKVIRGIAT